MKRFFYVTAGLLLTCAVSQADTMCLSYSEGKTSDGAPIGIGYGRFNEIETAFFLPASTVKLLEGNTITGINGCLASIADIEAVHIFIREELEGDNLAYYKFEPDQSNPVKRGVNELRFEKPYTITSGSGKGLYIGFGFTMTELNSRALSANTTPIPNAFFLRKANGRWSDCSEYGCASIEAVIEGDRLPERNLRLSRTDTPSAFAADRGDMPVTYFVHNFGSRTISGFDMVAEVDGEAVDKVHVSGDIASNAMKTGVVRFHPGLTVAGDKEIVYRLENLEEGEDQDPSDNVLSDSFEVVSKSYPRKVLSEEFTTEKCRNCPRVVEMLHELLARPEYSDIIQVAHHAGFQQDFLTQPFHEEYTMMYGGSKFAPGLCVDRAKQGPLEVIVFPDTEKTVEDMWNQRLDIPALVSVDISARYSEPARDRLEVTVSGEKVSRHLPAGTCATVWLVEDGIEPVEQVNAPAGFIHNNVTRACGSSDYWGDPVTFDGDSYTYSCEIPLDGKWKKENMSIVAFLGDNDGRWFGHTVLNAASMKFSEIENSGIDSIAGSGVPVEIRYYDLSGREVDSTAKGILLVKSVYDDGSARTVKMVR